MERVKVMVVEDSALARELIVDALGSDRRIEVICAVDCAEKALRLVPRLKPHVISMDVRLPGMDGIEATRRIMQEWPTPIVIVAADLSDETVNHSMEALRAGAMMVVEKPVVQSADAYRAMAKRLCEQVVNLSSVKVVRQRFGAGNAHRPRAASVAPALPAGGGFAMVAIVASTGGPPAVAGLLQGLGPSFGLPILLVQHIGAGFVAGHAAWLASACGMEVALVRDGEAPRPGRVHVGPGGSHLTIAQGRIRLVADSAERGHVPSGDCLFASLASSHGPHGIGILLTGMGADGARGLLDMRHAGAHTIVQDRGTSAVYGMPAVARALGADCEQLPIGAIAGRVKELVAAGRGSPAPREADRRGAA